MQSGQGRIPTFDPLCLLAPAGQLGWGIFMFFLVSNALVGPRGLSSPASAARILA